MSTVASADLVVDGIVFPAFISLPDSSRPLKFLGHGGTDMTIETILVKFTAIGVYAEEDLKTHLKTWGGKPASDLTAEETGYFKDFVDAPVAKLLKVGVIKGIKGSQYGGTLESSIRDRLAYNDLYEEEEEAALERLVEYFDTKNLPPSSAIYIYWPTPEEIRISVSVDNNLLEKFDFFLVNKNVASYLLHWYVGENPTSETTAAAVAEGVVALLA